MKIYILCNFNEIDVDDFSSSLDVEGLKRADDIIQNLLDLKIDKIYCSPYLKTIQTIYPFCSKSNKRINIESTFHDTMFNPIKTTVGAHISRRYTNHFGYSYFFDQINIHYKSKLFSSNISLKETETGVKNRIFPFLYNLCFRYKDKNKNILIVTHKNIKNFIMKFFDLTTNCSSVIDEQITKINIPDTWKGLIKS